MSREDTVAAARQNSVRLTQTNIDSLVDEIGDANYVPTRLSNSYDYFVFLSETDSLNPIRTEETEEYEPETYPWGV